LVLRPFVLRLFTLTPLTSRHDFSISAQSLSVYTSWLTAFHYAKLLFLMVIPFLICAFFIYAHVFKSATRS